MNRPLGVNAVDMLAAINEIKQLQAQRDRLLEFVKEFQIRTGSRRMMNTHGFLEPHDVSELRDMAKEVTNE